MGFSINSVTLDGNLTRDPELRSLTNTSVCSLRIAHTERYKNGQTGEWDDRANYFDVTVWGGQGEWLASNLGKGDRVVVQGRLRWREWEAKEGGKRQAVEVVADHAVPVGRREGGGRSDRTSRGENAMQERDASFGREDGFETRQDDFAPAAAPSGGGADADDDIPF